MIESRLDMPKLYLLYADDIIAVFNSQDHAKFLNDVNAVNKCITFTIESNNDNIIDFLDMRVSLQNNSLVTSWILKPSNAGLYTPIRLLTVLVVTKRTPLKHFIIVLKL